MAGFIKEEEERAKVDKNWAYQAGSGFREVVAPAVAQGAAVVTDVATEPLRKGIYNASNLVRGVVGAAPNEPFVKNPLAQGMNNMLAPAVRDTAVPYVAQSTELPAPTNLAPANARESTASGSAFLGRPVTAERMRQLTADPVEGLDYTVLPGGTELITEYRHDIATEQRKLEDARDRAAGRLTSSERNALGGGLGIQRTSGAQQISDPRREIMNGNVTTVLGGGSDRPSTYMPFPSAPGPAASANAINLYKAEIDAWRTLNGLVPLEQAQASLAETSATEMPEENKSQQRLRLAQTEESQARTGQIGKGVWQTVSVEEPGTAAAGFQPTKSAVQVNSATGETRPIGGGRRTSSVPDMLSSLSGDHKKRVIEHFGNRTDVTPESVFEYIKTLQ